MLTSPDVAAAVFPVVKLRAGYEIEQVSQLLAVVSSTLAAYENGHAIRERVTAAQVEAYSFYPTKFREGWDQQAVTAYLADVVDTLRTYEEAPTR